MLLARFMWLKLFFNRKIGICTQMGHLDAARSMWANRWQLTARLCPQDLLQSGTENTTTLVAVTINLLHELLDLLCPEDQTQETFRRLLRGMSAVMSDRASVMKSWAFTWSGETENSSNRWRITSNRWRVTAAVLQRPFSFGSGNSLSDCSHEDGEGGWPTPRTWPTDQVPVIQERLRKCCFKASTNIFLVEILKLCRVRKKIITYVYTCVQYMYTYIHSLAAFLFSWCRKFQSWYEYQMQLLQNKLNLTV